MCWKESAKQSGNEPEASPFFFELLLALLVSHTGAPTNASEDRFQYLIRAGVGWVSIVYLACMLQLICCSGHGLFVWHVCTGFVPFGLLVNHLACFQAVQPAFKPFGPIYKRDHFALYNRKRANWFINRWPVYKLVKFAIGSQHYTHLAVVQ